MQVRSLGQVGMEKRQRKPHYLCVWAICLEVNCERYWERPQPSDYHLVTDYSG